MNLYEPNIKESKYTKEIVTKLTFIKVLIVVLRSFNDAWLALSKSYKQKAT